MKAILTTDWAPHAEAIARRLAQVCAVVYCLGYCTGAWLHRLNDRLSSLLVRRRGLTPEDRAMCLEVLATTAPIIQRLATAAPPANIAPPRTADPMARAVLKVRSGMSQRQAASLCGVSRTSLQRALKG
jgi:hypothetical protein